MYFQGLFLSCLLGCLTPPVVRVAIIDAGYDGLGVKTCQTGHYDVTKDLPSIGLDEAAFSNHGSVVGRIINSYTQNYCAVIIKIFDSSGSPHRIAQGIYRAIQANVSVINLSVSSGSFYSMEEYNAFKAADAAGIKVFLASSNDNRNLDKNCDLYPICYKGLKFVPVGSSSGKSNRGSFIKVKEDYCAQGLCGSSMSTAIATGKYINEIQ